MLMKNELFLVIGGFVATLHILCFMKYYVYSIYVLFLKFIWLSTFCIIEHLSWGCEIYLTRETQIRELANHSFFTEFGQTLENL